MNIALVIGRMFGGGRSFGPRFGRWLLGGVVWIGRLRGESRMLGDELQEVWDADEGMEEHLFWYRAGRFVKAE